MTAADPRDGPRKDGRPGIDRLWDSQWVNVVNAPEVLAAADAEEAVHIAVRLTEQKMAENLAHARPEAVDDLRNKVAIAALQGLLSNPGGPVQANANTGTGFCNCNAEDVAGWALDIANAMIATLTPERAP